MSTLLSPCRTYGPSLLIAALVVAFGAGASRADELAKTLADAHETTVELDKPGIDEAQLAAAINALLVCAIPPPVDMIIQATTDVKDQQPGVPPPPTATVKKTNTGDGDGGGGAGGGGGGTVTTEDVPEPASLVTAIVGISFVGFAWWRRSGVKSQR